MRKTVRLLLPVALSLTMVDVPASVAQDEPSAPSQRPVTLQVPAFITIDASNGSHVVFEPGAARRVTLVRGSLEYSRVTVAGGRLVIDKCARKCPRGYRLEVEIVAPAVIGVSLAHGGRIQSRGSFPRQGELTIVVSNGGMIDVRSMAVDRVTASVEQGGGIMTAPQVELFASVIQGGVITYWGNARVRSSVAHGGVVQRGEERR